MSKPKRAALYVRVSTDRQTVENQTAKLTDAGIQAGQKGTYTRVSTASDPI